MTDFHEVIVHDHRQMVGGKAVGFQEDEIVQGRSIHLNGPAQQILDHHRTLEGALEPDNVRTSLGLLTGYLLRRQETAPAVVMRGFAPGLLLPAHLFQFLRGTKTLVRLSLLDEPMGPLLVEIEALGLNIGAVLPPDIRTFVPLQAEPTEAGHDILHGIGHVPFTVRVLDAQNESPATSPGVQPIV